MIRINSLEEVAAGKIINGETIFSNVDNKIITTIKNKPDKKMCFYSIKDNNLIPEGSLSISEKQYNLYLNSIKQNTN